MLEGHSSGSAIVSWIDVYIAAGTDRPERARMSDLKIFKLLN